MSTVEKAIADRKAADFAARGPLALRENAFGLLDKGTRFAEKIAAQFGEFGAVAVASEQWCAEIVFKALDLFGQRGLGEIERLRRKTKMQRVCERDKGLE
nr:hypothetical protein [Paraburkholderia bannensis]